MQTEVNLPCEQKFRVGNANFPFVCEMSELRLLSLKGNLPQTIAYKIIPL